VESEYTGSSSPGIGRSTVGNIWKPHLKFAEDPDDNGAIILYNTEAPQNLGSIALNKNGTAATDAAGQIAAG
jgi:hypothetical protein